MGDYDNDREGDDEGEGGDKNMYLPPLSGCSYLHRDPRSQDPKHVGTEWYWKVADGLPELWIRNAHQLDQKKIKQLRTAWSRYKKLGIHGPGDGAGRSAKKWQNRAALKEQYAKLEKGKRAAMEVALARYEHFVIDAADVDCTLDYHEKESDGKKGPKSKSGDTVCLVM